MTMCVWRIDLRTASRKARLAFSIKCQRSVTFTACGGPFLLLRYIHRDGREMSEIVR